MTRTSCHRVDYYGLVRPRVGYRHAGDAAIIAAYGGKLLAGIVDVLGHGPEAHEVAMKAKHFLDNGPEPDDPLEPLKGLHDTLKGTRGAAAGLAVLDSAMDSCVTQALATPPFAASEPLATGWYRSMGLSGGPCARRGSSG